MLCKKQKRGISNKIIHVLQKQLPSDVTSCFMFNRQPGMVPELTITLLYMDCHYYTVYSIWSSVAGAIFATFRFIKINNQFSNRNWEPYCTEQVSLSVLLHTKAGMKVKFPSEASCKKDTKSSKNC